MDFAPAQTTAVRVPTQQHGTVWLDATRRPHLFQITDTGGVERLPIRRFEQLLAGEPERSLGPGASELDVLEAASALPPGPSLLEVLATLPDPTTPGRSSPIWTAYLEARARMLTAQRERARESFEQVRKKLRPGNTTRVIATLFENHLRFTEPALEALA